MESASAPAPYRVGRWLPSDEAFLARWLEAMIHNFEQVMCLLAVGMAEVSSCQITVYEGQRVRKGDQIGMFHYGGSTHCLIFGPDVKLEFDHHGQRPGLHAANIHVNARITTVVR